MDSSSECEILKQAEELLLNIYEEMSQTWKKKLHKLLFLCLPVCSFVLIRALCYNSSGGKTAGGVLMIEFSNVTKTYNGNIGIENVSVAIEQGEFVFLVGPSGAGKSTFIKLIIKEINPESGSIKIKGREITNMPNREIPNLRRNIGMVFQDFRLLPRKTVYENVAFAMEVVHKTGRSIKRHVPQALELVGIRDKADRYPDELSAGEQQRVAIARAIINNPRMLIADEPTGNLDPETAWEIMSLLNEINRKGTTIVMVTHSKDIVDRMGKRVIAIENGHIVRDDVGAYSVGPDDGQQTEYTGGLMD